MQKNENSSEKVSANQKRVRSIKSKPAEIIYEFPSQLFREHDAKTPTQYAREAYDRTECGVWTNFLELGPNAEVIRKGSASLNDYENTLEYAQRHFIGVQHGTIVEGSDAEFNADDLCFPFTDDDLQQTWDFLDGEVEGCGPVGKYLGCTISGYDIDANINGTEVA